MICAETHPLPGHLPGEGFSCLDSRDVLSWVQGKGAKTMEARDTIPELRPFLNEAGQLAAMPSKYKKKLLAYYYLATKIEAGRQYTQKDINELLDHWAVFHDPATLRRELYDRRLLDRTLDGSRYWRQEDLPSLERFLARYLQ